MVKRAEVSMDRVLAGATLIAAIVAARMIFLPENSVLGPLLTFGSVIAFFVWCHWMISSGKLQQMAKKAYVYSDPNGPNQGFDPEVVESARRRADGIE